MKLKLATKYMLLIYKGGHIYLCRMVSNGGTVVAVLYVPVKI